MPPQVRIFINKIEQKNNPFLYKQVGVGWSGYFVKFFNAASRGRIQFGENWTQPTVVWTESPPTISYVPGHYFNVPGFVIIMLITIILCIG